MALAGGALGTAAAAAGLGALVSLVPASVPRLAAVAVNGPVLAFAIAVSAATAPAFGTLPALRASRPDMQAALRQEGRGGTASRGRERTRRALVAVEVALACVLVVGAGLLGRSFARLAAVDEGFDPANVLIGEINLPRDASRARQAAATQRALVDRLRALPGVESAALAYDDPLSAAWSDVFAIPGRDSKDDGLAWQRIVSTGYLRTVRIPVLRGRGFTETDDEAHPRVVIGNEAFARRYFPDADPIGRRMIVPAPTRPAAAEAHEIVGVVGDVRFLGPAVAAEPAFYLPIAQSPQPDLTVLVRTSGDPLAVAPALRAAVHAVDPALPIGRLTTLAALADGSVAEPRFTAVLVGTFGVMAFRLAALGVYGLLAYTVSQRRREIGLRLALGAQPRDVTRLVVGDGLAVTLAGVAAGLAAAAALMRFVRSLLFQVSPIDPVAFLGAAAALAAVALVASWAPLRRAGRIDPIRVLREE